DIVQDTFIAVGQRLDVVPADKERAWVLGVARNIARNARRSRHRFHRFTDALAATLATQASHLYQDRPTIEMTDTVHSAFGQLSTSDQEIVLLAAWHDLAPADISVVLDISPERASDRLYNARKRFRKHYDRAGGT
ncbi:MAG TPA: sigma-70 family RNA polymerase sigma factor, partial [Ilumatobacteraceae bacterium]|nr:sigma-70 family RNA polymerase sigma factor [Ilumatobacteraceae bacterium]